MEFPLALAGVAAIWAVAVITPGPKLLVTGQAAVAGSRRAALFVALLGGRNVAQARHR